MWVRAAVVASAVALASACNKPDGDVTGYLCPEFEDDFSGDLSKWTQDYGEWMGTPPAVMEVKNTWVGGGAGNVRIKKETPAGSEPHWVSNKFENQCACGFKALTSGLLASRQTFGEGYYEANVRTNSKSPFMSAFWLQGAKAEINVMEFVGLMRGSGDKTKLWTDYHCFDPEDKTGASTKSKQEFFEPDQTNYNVVDYHTYGVEWKGNALTFYANGKAIRTANADCLVGEKMTVLFSHETRPEFDGDNEGENKLTKELASDMTYKVDYFRYYKAAKAPQDCAAFGWDNANDNVCTSVNTGGVCGMKTAVTFNAAKQTCEAAGARLCTPDEVAISHTGLGSASATGCTAWKKWKKVWVTGGDCSDGRPSRQCGGPDNPPCLLQTTVEGATASPNGFACTDATKASGFTQCCRSEPVKKFCGNTDAATQKMYSPTVNGVCARADWGISDNGSKKCQRLSSDNAEAFCKARGGSLCTTQQLEGIVRNGGKTVDVARLPPGKCAGAKPANTITWLLNKEGSDEDVHCKKENTKKGSDFYRPITKYQGFMRANKKSGKIVKSFRCGYKGNVKNTKGQKYVTCCFQE